MRIQLILPYPPSVNSIWRTGKKGKWYLTKAAKDFKEVVGYYVYSKRARELFAKTDRLSVKLIAYPPDARKRDLDNLCKITLDAMQDAGVYHDDCQIKEMHLKMEQPFPKGKVEITIEKIKDSVK